MIKFNNGIIESYDKHFKIDLIPKSNKTSRPQYKMDPNFITIHNTANPGASAKANTEYVDSTSKYVSWHFTVGDGIVYQELPINEVAWHCGDGANGPGNRKSIGIEVSEVDGAYETAVEFIKDLMESLNFNTDQVVPHKKWNGKNCPRLILPMWNEFIKSLKESKGYKIAGPPTATLEQMKQWAMDRKANPLFVDMADVFYEVAIDKGCDPVVVYAQSAKETGFFKFGGVIDETYHNTCGLKTSGGGGNYDPDAHMKFKNWKDGISAHVDHLMLYAGAEGYPNPNTLDPRHFAWIKGKATTVEMLSGKWAPSKTYGESIVDQYINGILGTKVNVIDYKALYEEANAKLQKIKEIL